MPLSAHHRLTLVITGTPIHPWERSRVLLVDSLKLAEAAVTAFDVERIVLDPCASADEFLFLLVRLPNGFAGDVLHARADGTAFLSATGRGGDRVLYALAPHDVAFYLETHALLASPELALTA